MKFFNVVSLFICLVITPLAFAAENFDFIYPGGEGNSDSAKPFINEFYNYLNDATQKEWTGEYINESDEGQKRLKKVKSGYAIVSPQFYKAQNQKLGLKPLLRTIPEYATGPFERFYIVSHKDTDVLTLMNKPFRVNLFTSQNMKDTFLNEQIFFENEQIKTIPWNLQETGNILGALQKIAAGKSGTFALLTGFEFQMIQKLKAKKQEFKNLKLIYTSPELPTARLVSFGNTNSETNKELQSILLKMKNSLKGNVILKNLRLKGFAP